MLQNYDISIIISIRSNITFYLIVVFSFTSGDETSIDVSTGYYGNGHQPKPSFHHFLLAGAFHSMRLSDARSDAIQVL